MRRRKRNRLPQRAAKEVSCTIHSCNCGEHDHFRSLFLLHVYALNQAVLSEKRLSRARLRVQRKRNKRRFPRHPRMKAVSSAIQRSRRRRRPPARRRRFQVSIVSFVQHIIQRCEFSWLTLRGSFSVMNRCCCRHGRNRKTEAEDAVGKENAAATKGNNRQDHTETEFLSRASVRLLMRCCSLLRLCFQ
jgi:hypothetical protein